MGQVGTGLWRSRTRILTVLCEVDPRLWLSRTRILTVMCEVNPRLSLRRGRPGLPRITSADRWQAEFDYTIAIPLQWLHATHAHPFNSFRISFLPSAPLFIRQLYAQHLCRNLFCVCCISLRYFAFSMLPPVVLPTLVAITLLSLSLRALGIPLGSTAAAHSHVCRFGFFNSLFPLADPCLEVLPLATLVVLLLELRALFFMWE